MNERAIKTFEDLECWKACRSLRQFVYKQVIPALPGEEKYLLIDQLKRSARSTTANTLAREIEMING